MKIAFLTDFHIGFEQEGRQGEAFLLAKSALSQAIKAGAELIVFNGDLFNRALPTQEDFFEAFRLFSSCHNAPKPGIKITFEKNGKAREVQFSGIPVIAIHGTHEFRGRDFRNALEVMDSAGFLVYIHAAKAIVENSNEKIVFHGLGGVPEKKARDALLKWNPKPVPSAKNVLLLHQSFKEFLPFDDEMIASLSISDLPDGFDFVVNGHLHTHAEFKENGKILLIPGSTIITQLKQSEAENAKGFYFYDSLSEKIEFKELEEFRSFYYKKIELANASVVEVLNTAREAIVSMLSIKQEKKMKPLVRIVLKGSLAKGLNSEDIDFSGLIEEFREKAVVSILSSFSGEDFSKKINELKKLQREKQSISEMGLAILEKNLKETGFGNAFDVRRMLSLLSEGNTEKALQLLLELEPKAQPEAMQKAQKNQQNAK